MKVSPLEYNLDYLSYRGARSSGMHLTDCLDYIEERLKPKKQKVGPFFSPDEDEYEGWEDAAPLGFAWEDLCIKSLEAQGHTLLRGEETRDGIAMTPDAFDVCCWRLWEFKFTWKWLGKHPPEQNWRWLMQVKAYCRIYGTLEAVIAPMFVVGNGRPPQPTRAFRTLEFTQAELDENWRSVLQARDQVGR